MRMSRLSLIVVTFVNLPLLGFVTESIGQELQLPPAPPTIEELTNGTVKIGDQFTNRKVLVERRRILPVFCLDEGNPVWCPELPPAEGAKINEDTIRAVQLTYCWQPANFYL